MDPMTMAALGGLGQSIIGTKQVGPAAPPYMPGMPQAPFQLTNLPQGNGLLDALSTAGQQSAVTEYGKEASLADIDNQVQETKPGPFANFLGGLDKGLQSPAQVLGLGLLSQLTGQHPAAGLGGLLAMGLYNRNK